jgi:hypothetical protein
VSFIVLIIFNVNSNKGFNYLIKVKVLNVFYNYNSIIYLRRDIVPHLIKPIVIIDISLNSEVLKAYSKL